MIIGILVLILLAILFPGLVRVVLILAALGALAVAVDFQRWEDAQAKKDQQAKEQEWK